MNRLWTENVCRDFQYWMVGKVCGTKRHGGVCVFTCMFVGVYTHVYICMYFGKMKLKLVSIQDKSICIYWSNILVGWLFKALSVAVCIESTSEKSWLELIPLAGTYLICYTCMTTSCFGSKLLLQLVESLGSKDLLHLVIFVLTGQNKISIAFPD